MSAPSRSMTARITLAEAATLAGVSKRTLLQAAKSGRLRTVPSIRGYLTTATWVSQWNAAKRPGRPTMKEQHP